MDLSKGCPDCGSDSFEVKRLKDRDPSCEQIYYSCTNENCPRHSPDAGFTKRVRKTVVSEK